MELLPCDLRYVVLGTLGNVRIILSWAPTAHSLAASFAFRRFDRVGCAGAGWPSDIPLPPFAGLGGFDEEYRRCERYWDAAALGAEAVKVTVIGEAGIVERARLTDDENMVYVV